ncbi:MAG: DegT/DnrJ/EryC1/StrS family aminotransferase [Actinomycetota bacterium]|nr:DegT/DnrJ/EryC1/StrS family aminotransferase [Actinomycetota bacterium]
MTGGAHSGVGDPGGKAATRATLRPQVGVGGVTITERAKELVRSVLDSGRLTAGPMVARFEQEVAALHGCRYGLMCSSGTAALQIALGALRERRGWQDGDEVIVPAVTFIATSNVVLYNGMKPVFVDVDPLEYTLDPALLEAALTPRTRAVIPVHVAGLPCDMGPILEIARAHDLAVVEDCAESMFARYHGEPVGSFGDIAAFSTYAAHMVTTGVGGLCTSDDAELMVLLKSLMNHGRDSIYIRIDDDRVEDPRALFEVVDSRFSFVRLGHSFRVTEMEAALGVAQLDDREAMCQRRREIARRYGKELAGLPLQLPYVPPGREHVFMFYPLVVTDPVVRRADLVLHLEQRGVETRYLLPLINQPVYRRVLGDHDAQCPVAAALNETAFYVGCHPEMTDTDVDHVIESLLSFFGEA